MKAIFKFKSKPVSINNFYYANKAHGIRTEAKEWQSDLFIELAKNVNKEIITNLKAKFDPKIHGYKFVITYHAPASTYYNKKGELSSRQIDLSNCEKSLIDVFMLPKYNGVYGACNLDMDDKWLIELSSKKLISADEFYYTTVLIEIISLPKVIQIPKLD